MRSRVSVGSVLVAASLLAWVGCRTPPPPGLAPPPGPAAVPVSPWTVPTALQRLPVLRHDAGDRWPVLAWVPLEMAPGDGSFGRAEALPAETYRELARRGLAPFVRFEARYIPMAQAIQAAGCPVIIVDALGGNGPGAEAPDTLHTFEPGFAVETGKPIYPCHLVTTGWERHAAQLRTTLGQFRDAGVKVCAVWADWEVEPFPADFSRWRQAKHCTRCRAMLPKGVLSSPFRHARFVWTYRQGLYSRYLAEPVLEVFPECSVGNYDGVFSSKEHPAWTVWGAVFPPQDIGRFTASMPDVYGSDAMFSMFWYGSIFEPFHPSAPIQFLRHRWYRTASQEKADRVYTRVMLAQVSADAANRAEVAPDKPCIPYVARYVEDADPAVFVSDCLGFSLPGSRKATPPARTELSRERYREILRHVWLRGAAAMVVFNPFIPQHPDVCVEEVEDVLGVYDEMLAHRQFFERGTVMNTAIPSLQDRGLVWSGLRLPEQALVRVFVQGKRTRELRLRPWPDAAEVSLAAPPQGATYRLARGGEGAQVGVEQIP